MTALPKRLANTFALATAVLWVACTALVWVLPGLTWQITEWWMHGMDLTAMGGWQITFSNFIWGGVTLIIGAWLTGWVAGWAFRKSN